MRSEIEDDMCTVYSHWGKKNDRLLYPVLMINFQCNQDHFLTVDDGGMIYCTHFAKPFITRSGAFLWLGWIHLHRDWPHVMFFKVDCCNTVVTVGCDEGMTVHPRNTTGDLHAHFD
jgi:hypothetical protein